MQITDILAQMGGLKSIANELGVSEKQAATGAEALLPAILGGFKKQAQAQPTGLGGLGGLLGQLGGSNLLEQVLSPQPTDVSQGNNVLGQIFGSKDVSRAVAQNAASSTGLDLSVLKKMLPMLAMLVTGFMAKQSGSSASSSGGGLGGLLGGLLGGKSGNSARTSSSGGLGGLLGGLFGGKSAGGTTTSPAGSGLAAMLDLDGDGNPLDDILNIAGKALR